MPSMKKLFEIIYQCLGVELTSSQIEAFMIYENLLLKWNGKFNLTTITDPNEIHIKHFLDSLTLLKIIQKNGEFSLIDIGTGAGFPGIPLKIILPEMALTLVESSHKKAEFCKVVVEELKLSNTSVLTARVEELGKDSVYREQYDWAVARAVADLSVLSEYLLPLVKIGGKAIAMKSANSEDEIKRVRHALEIMGGEIIEKIKVDLPEDFGERTLIVINKIAATPAAYPRRTGIPVKRPIS
jgi:16S rRNA (guanine527-N7)-methyltransferase